MMRIDLRYCAVLLVGIILLACPAQGQNPADSSRISSRWSFGAEGGFTHVIDVLDINQQLLKTNNLGSGSVIASFSTSPSERSLWAHGFNYPTLTLGLNYTPYGCLKPKEGNTGLGSILSAFAGADFYVLRRGSFSTGPYLRAGLAYADRIYHPETNPDNQYIGTPLEGYFALGWQCGIMVSDLYEITLSGGFNHHSCGKMYLPNWGVTNASANLGLRYHLSEPYRGRKAEAPKPDPDLEKNRFKKGLIWSVYAASGLHSCETIWEAEGHYERTKPCVRGILGGDMAYRYSPFLSSGIGLEGGWTSGINRLREAETALNPGESFTVSPFWVGMGVIQSVHYGNFSAHVRVGWYLYRRIGPSELGHTGTCYQKVGMRYRFNRTPLFLGFDMKTHRFDSSDCLELSFGVDI